MPGTQQVLRRDFLSEEMGELGFYGGKPPWMAGSGSEVPNSSARNPVQSSTALCPKPASYREAL